MNRGARHSQGLPILLRRFKSLKNSSYPAENIFHSSCLQPSYQILRQFSVLNQNSQPMNLSTGGLFLKSSNLNYLKPVYYSTTNEAPDDTRDSSKANSESQPESEPDSGSKPSASVSSQEEESASDEEKESIKTEGEDLLELLAFKEGEVANKDKEIKKLHDSLLRSYAEMENLRDRTKREIESARKFAVQEFAKGLLDVADNLTRASSVTKASMKTAETSESTNSNLNSNSDSNSDSNSENSAKLLQSLLDGVDMTQKQLMQVFKKHGLEQYEPLNENFDPNLHNALFEITDLTKTPGTIAIVTKTGYKLNDRVIRPAEVGVVKDSN